MNVCPPKAEDIDGHSFNSNLKSLLLPHVFRGRDFTAKNDIFLQKILELDETWYRKPEINVDDDNRSNNDDCCHCYKFLKCQHIIIHNPSILTYEFAQKTWLNSIKNNKLNLCIKKYPIRAGNTSSTRILQLIYTENNKIYPLITTVKLGCHINIKTQRPIKICDAERNHINKELSKKNKNQLIEINNKCNQLKLNLDKMNGFLVNHGKECIFKCKIQIQHTDIDWNLHVNQSIYGKYIENTLLEYCKDYYNAKYHINSITINYVEEMRINGNNNNGLPFCTVKILNDCIIDKKDIKREIIGIIKKDNKLCIQFKLVLIKYKHYRLFIERSRL